MLICVLLALAISIIYAQTAGYGYIAYDDDQYVYENLRVNAGFTIANVLWAFTTFFYANWHPLTWLSYMLGISVFGPAAGAQHLMNVAFHIISTLLLYCALVRMTQRPWRCAVVAAIFAVHPLRVESVAWISERKDVLSTLFEMLTLFLYVLYTERRSAGRYIGVAAAFALSLLSKPMAVTFPFVLLLLDFWPLNRLDWKRAPESARSIFLEKAPLFGMALAVSVLTFVAQQRYGAVSSLSRLSLSARIGNAAIAYATYVQKFIWPVNLAVLYPIRDPGLTALVVAVLVLIGLSASVWRYGVSCPYLIVGWLWYLGMLLPVIGLVQVGSQSMADRYTYVPTIGLAIALVWTVADIVERHPVLRPPVATITAAVLASMTGMAWHQTTYWKNSRTLFEHTISVTKDNFLMQNNLGVVALHEHSYAEAATLFRSALAVSPAYATAHENLGHTLIGSGAPDQAFIQISEALRLDPKLADAHADMAVLLVVKGDLQGAKRQLADALRIDPMNADYGTNMCFVLRKLGLLDEAIAVCTNTLRIHPDLPNARFNLGVALSKKRETDAAIAELSQLLKSNADYPEARSELDALLGKRQIQ